MTEDVILVSHDDVAIGVSEKLRAHLLGLRHRAVSVILESPRGQLLLQRRAWSKYHSAGLWSNACCGHPRPSEAIDDTAQRKLREELGLSCRLDYLGSVSYTLGVSPTMTENEIDHVFVGTIATEPNPDPSEVSELRWIDPAQLLQEVKLRPAQFSHWLPEVLTVYARRREPATRRASAAVTAGMIIALTLLGVRPIQAQPAGGSYQVPPKAIVGMLDEAPPPDIQVSPRGDVVAVIESPAMPGIADVARPYLGLAGVRIDPARNSRRRLGPITRVSLRSTADGSHRSITMPAHPAIDWIGFSPDGARFAFTQAEPDGIRLWIGDVATGKAGPRGAANLNAVYKTPCAWVATGASLLCATTVATRGAAPAAARIPTGPVVREARGVRASAQTYPDLLASAVDDELFEYYGTVQWVRLDAATGARQLVGPPGLHPLAAASPDGRYVLVVTLKRPFSRLLPFYGFPMAWEIWDASGTRVSAIADLPSGEGVRSGSVLAGPRDLNWKPSDPATLIWIESLDSPDPRTAVPHRDRVMALAAPFRLPAVEVARTEFRCADVVWTEDGTAIINEYNRPTQLARSWILGRHDAAPRQLSSRKVSDVYADLGNPLRTVGPSGTILIVQSGGDIFLSGAGASPQGARPFLDRLNLQTLQRQRIYRNEREHEAVLGLLSRDAQRIVSRIETPERPPETVVRRTTDDREVAVRLTVPPAAHEAFSQQQIVTYARKDGVRLSGTLHTPAGWSAEKGPLPLVLWAYPREVADASTAGQVTGAQRYVNASGPSQLLLVTQGFAVLDDPSMPIVGPPATANDTFVEQLVANAEAAIDHLVGLGVADRSRVVVGGHSYGAFMAVNLLAHSDLFRAGIARSGAYNRTLTPFGFQNESRTLWEAPDLYQRLSPFNFAHRIKEPLLLIHGDADSNPGTFPIQSERLFLALQGTGGTARYVSLPFEAHGYVARESILHTVAEMINWAVEWTRPSAVPTAAREREQ
jgi:isopentenyl-diphosphate delta-isomerase type 1